MSFSAASNGAPTLTGKWIIGDVAGTNAQVVAVNAQAAVNPGLSFTTGDVTVNTGSQLFFEPRLSTYGATSGTQNLTVTGQGPVIPNAVGNDTFDGAIKLLGDAKVNLTSHVNTNFAGPVLLDLQAGSSVQLTQLTFNGPVSGSFPLTIHGDDFASVIFNGTNNLTGSTIMTGGELDVNPGSSMGTGDLTMNQHKSRDTTVALSNAAQSIGSLSSIYDGSPINPVTQTLTLNGTVLTIHQAVSADYGILPADGATPAGSDSIITGSGSIVYAGNPGIELSLSDPNNSYTGSTTIDSGSLAIFTDTNLGTAPAVSMPGQLTVNGGQFHAMGGSPLVLAPTRGFAAGPNGGTLRTDAGTPLTIQGVTTFSNAAATLTIASGSYVRFNASSNATSVASGSSVTVASGATLELAGTASALSDGTHNVNVVNNGSAPGGLLSTGTNQNVGLISGTGDTSVAAGSDLTADGIVQYALIIGGSPGNLGQVTIRASSNMVMAGDPEGGTDGLAIVESLTPSTPFGSGAGRFALVGNVGGASSLGDFGSFPVGNSVGGSAAVPEPATWLLASLAIAGLLAARRGARSVSRQTDVIVGARA